MAQDNVVFDVLRIFSKHISVGKKIQKKCENFASK